MKRKSQGSTGRELRINEVTGVDRQTKRAWALCVIGGHPEWASSQTGLTPSQVTYRVNKLRAVDTSLPINPKTRKKATYLWALRHGKSPITAGLVKHVVPKLELMVEQNSTPARPPTVVLAYSESLINGGGSKGPPLSTLRKMANKDQLSQEALFEKRVYLYMKEVLPTLEGMRLPTEEYEARIKAYEAKFGKPRSTAPRQV